MIFYFRWKVMSDNEVEVLASTANLSLQRKKHFLTVDRQTRSSSLFCGHCEEENEVSIFSLITNIMHNEYSPIRVKCFSFLINYIKLNLAFSFRKKSQQQTVHPAGRQLGTCIYHLQPIQLIMINQPQNIIQQRVKVI